MSRLILGIDIRSDSVSAVLVKSGLKSTLVEDHVFYQAPNSSNAEMELAGFLEQLTDRWQLNGATLLVALPANGISFRNVHVPFKEPRKIRQTLPFELESTLPVAIDEVVLDYHSTKFSESSKLITATVEKQRIEMMLKTMKDHQLDPAMITFSGFSTVSSMIASNAIVGDTICMDIDPEQCTVFFTTTGSILMVRCLKNRRSKSLDEKWLVSAINQMAFTFETIYDREFQPGHVMLTGNGINDTTIEADISMALKLPIQRVDLVATTDVEMADEAGKRWVPSLHDNALALALVESERLPAINFRQGPYAHKQRWQIDKKQVIRTGVLAGLVFILFMLNLILDNYFLNQKYSALDEQVKTIFKKTFPEVTRIEAPVHQMKIKIDELKDQALLAGNSPQGIRKIDMLNIISRRITQNTDVVFGRMVISQNNITISGTTDTFNAVDAIKTMLESENVFNTVKITSAQMDRKENRVRFKVRIDL